MPWFKDGAHDRIFNSMLNGAVCLSDGSRYLDEILHDGKDYRLYDLAHLEKLPDMVHDILSNRVKWEQMQKNAYTLASKKHTWADRARSIHQEILCKIP